MRLMESVYENADITIITGGECGLSKASTEEFRKKAAAYQAAVTGILLDKEAVPAASRWNRSVTSSIIQRALPRMKSPCRS